MKGLWCHYPKKMNDPFDCLGYIDRKFNKKQIADFKEHLDVKNKTLQNLLKCDDNKIADFINQQRKITIEKFAFCSLSKSVDDILMWSHYASGHSGFALEFEFGEEEINSNFQEVKYVKVLPEFRTEKLAKFLNGEDEYLEYLLSDISIKAHLWKKEKELRIWRKKPTYYHYKLKNLKAVYFGINCSLETKAILLHLLNEKGENFQYYTMEIKDNPIRLTYK
ncbi:DUF2971 domain-containing protein [Cochleicola gelatinilyticus]|nr:DUF2971 domain-containing protein [Cochleicola gelatinilyticus]